MFSHFFVTADVTPNKTQNERLKVAFRSMFLQRKTPQRFGTSSFSKFHRTRRKNPFVTPRTVLQRAKTSLCNRSQFRMLLLPHRFIKIRPSHQRPVSIESLTICRIPEFPKFEQNRKSCGNVRIWRKRAAVLRKKHSSLIKSFRMNVLQCVTVCCNTPHTMHLNNVPHPLVQSNCSRRCIYLHSNPPLLPLPPSFLRSPTAFITQLIWLLDDIPVGINLPP